MAGPSTPEAAREQPDTDTAQGPLQAWRRSFGELSASLVNWLVPTTGVLAGCVGWVVNSAHRSLLGFPTDEGGFDAGRASDAADFARDLLTRLADLPVSLSSGEPVPLAGEGAVLAVSALLLAGVLWAGARAPRWLGRIGLVPLLVALLLGLSAVKFLHFDAPVMRLENVIVGPIDFGAPPPLAPASTAAPAAPASAPAAGPGRVEQLIGQRTGALWRALVCSRMAGVVLDDASPLAQAPCKGSADTPADLRQAFSQQLQGEFNARLAMAVLIAAGALCLLAVAGMPGRVLAVLLLACQLTVPYAWGKLLMPVDYMFAHLRLLPAAGEPPLRTEAHAFVLSREGGMFTLLQDSIETCSAEGSTSVSMRFSMVPASRVLVVEQIYRRDVIDWASRTERRCPDIQPPPPPPL